MEVCLLIKQRLEELGLDQKDLATAAGVTESYISQLLTRKKRPPAPDQSDIYQRIAKLLKLPSGQLSKLAEAERKEELKRKLGAPAAPLFKEIRELILSRCSRADEKQVRSIFAKQPFGELERLVTQKLLDVVKQLAKEELENEDWLRLAARLGGRSYEQMRVMLLEFLETDVFNLSPENCVAFLDPLIESWRIDLTTFGMDVVLNRHLASGHARRFEFVERRVGAPHEEEAGLKDFLADSSLSGEVTGEEIEFLKKLRFKGRRPKPLYFYRELQNLRDPLHFHTP